MFTQVKAEIIKLMGDKIFARNLSLTLIITVSSLCTLANLQSHKTQVVDNASIINISRPSVLKIIVK